MGAYKLEAFSSIDPKVNELEKLRSEILDRERNDAYARGFKDGVGVTRDAVDAERNKLLATISQAIDAFKVTEREAALAMQSGLLPLISEIVSKLAPHLAEDGFSAHLTEAIKRATDRAVTAKVEVRLSPERASLVGSELGPEMSACEIIADPTVGPTEAQIRWDAGYDRIDMGALSDVILAELEMHGPRENEASDE